MKRALHLIVAVAALFSLQSQAQQVAQDVNALFGPAQGTDLLQTRSTDVQDRIKTNVFFEEDFSNGFEGSNGVGPWTIVDSSPDTSIWMMATPQSPAGEFSNTGEALNSSTSGNGWAIFDADNYNTPVSDGFEAVQGYLTSPVINCEGRQTVILQYEQRFRYCCQQASPLTVEVTIDGGANWTSFQGEGDFIPTANTLSDNQLNTIDISCIATEAAEVQFRFAYNAEFNASYSHYFWGIDDVTVSEYPFQFDLSVNEVVNGDVLLDYEYMVTPLSQVPEEDQGGLLVGVMFENKGIDDQTNIAFNVDVLDGGGVLVASVVTEPLDLVANRNSAVCPVDQDTVYVFTDWDGAEEGQYTLRVEAISDQELTNTDDDVLERPIYYDACQFGHESEEFLDIELRASLVDNNTPSLGFENTGYGNIFTFINEETAIGASVRFGQNTDVGSAVEIRLYEIGEGENLGTAPFTSTFYEVQDTDVPANLAASMPVYIEFDDEVDIDPELTYMLAAMIDESGSEDELTVYGWFNSDGDNSAFQLGQTSDLDFAWFSRINTPAIRMVLGEDCVTSIDEYDSGIDLGSLEAFPNPTAGQVTVRFAIDQAMETAVRVSDYTGRVVFSEDLGTLVAGQQILDLDLSAVAPGLYHYTLETEMGRVTRSLVVK